jgi:integrase
MIALLWRAGLRISETLSLQASDLDRSRGVVLVRRGTGGKRREVGMDRWAWDQLNPWLEIRHDYRPTVGRTVDYRELPTPLGDPVIAAQAILRISRSRHRRPAARNSKSRYGS